MEWGNYIGIPYEEVNCWDLIRKIYSDCMAIDLRDQEQAREYLREDWVPIRRGQERQFDVLLFKDCSDDWHVGMVIGNGRFIHNRHGANSCIEQYKATQWTDRLKAIYRHKQRLIKSISF